MIMVRRSHTPLYPGHRPTNSFQKALIAVGSSLSAFLNPYRGDMVAAFGDVTATSTLKTLRYRMLSDNSGREILRDRPIINSQTLPLEELKTYPQNTLGYRYSQFMLKHKFSSDDREPVHYVDDPDLAYIMLRYRQTHDFNHVLSGIPRVNLFSEVVVKAFEAVQMRLPMCVLGAAASNFKLPPKDFELFWKVYLPWAIYAGSRAKLLLNVYYEKEMMTPFDELLKKIDLIQAPVKIK